MIYDVYFFESAINSFLKHAQRFAIQQKEALGLLTGKRYKFQNKNYIIVSHYITALNDAGPSSVRFKLSAFHSLAKKLRKYGSESIVGWAHSHPGFGCFLSSTDIATHKSYFSDEFSIALVVDPLKNPIEKKVFIPKNNGYISLSWAVISRRN